jgi:hypothetical protein
LAPVLRVIMHDNDAQIITLSADKEVRIWDARTQRCLQAIPDEALQVPENSCLQISITLTPPPLQHHVDVVRPRLPAAPHRLVDDFRPASVRPAMSPAPHALRKRLDDASREASKVRFVAMALNPVKRAPFQLKS